MKFYVIEIADGDAKIKGKAMYEYDNLNKALATFHKKIGTARDSELYTSCLIMIIDSDGMPRASEKYTAEQISEEEGVVNV